MEKAFSKYLLAFCVILFSAFGLTSVQVNHADALQVFLQQSSGFHFAHDAVERLHPAQQIAYAEPILKESFKIEATEIVEESELSSSKKNVDGSLFIAAFISAFALHFILWLGRKRMPEYHRLANTLVLKRYIAFQVFRI